MKRLAVTWCLCAAFFIPNWAIPADVVPDIIKMPGTQPLEISNLESPDKCDNCHGGYNTAVEPAHNWRGSMMAHAGRDPIFWATMAIAEQDLDGAGDLCLRCHSTGGWLAGRSTPTDGSGLAAGDSDGVECDYCHKLTNPDDSEHQGVMNAPFIANQAGTGEGYYGSGMSSMWSGSDKLGPYVNADARHQFMKSAFHRDREFCGTCHDVSNPAVGQLAHNAGALFDFGSLDRGSGGPGDTVAFNAPPYRYGVVERTFSEHMSSLVAQTRVDDYPTTLAPEGLEGGALEAIYEATWDPARQTANYEDGDVRYYTCQTCHMRAVTGAGANKRGVPVRSDLPLHDMTGGNYWMADVIEYLDGRGKLRLGGGMSPGLVQAMQDGALRAREQLQLAATLEVSGDTLRVVNHTGHKLITGYPEGRRMWLNVKWYRDDAGEQTLLREDGEYGDITVDIDGAPTTVRSIRHPESTRLYEAHMGMTPTWAGQLLALGYPSDMALAYDRLTGAVALTLGQLQGQAEPAETFHFALNNTVVKDNRIPPYGMSAAEATRRNISVDASRFPADGDGRHPHYDDVVLAPPTGAEWAQIDLLYQPTSWEYVQFLYLANRGDNAFLGDEGANLLEAWLATGMAEPVVMASATWSAGGGDPGGDPVCTLGAPATVSAEGGDKSVTLAWTAVDDADAYSLYYDQADKAQLVADLDCVSGSCTDYVDTGLTNGQTYCYKVTARDGSCESAFSEIACATPQNPGQQTGDLAGAQFAGIGSYVRIGKGKNADTQWVESATFSAGDEIVMRLDVRDAAGNPVPGAIVTLAISGPESLSLDSGTSGSDGRVEVRWRTAAPNKKGAGGTASGDYLATVVNVDAAGYAWDDSRYTQAFAILQ